VWRQRNLHIRRVQGREGCRQAEKLVPDWCRVRDRLRPGQALQQLLLLDTYHCRGRVPRPHAGRLATLGVLNFLNKSRGVLLCYLLGTDTTDIFQSDSIDAAGHGIKMTMECEQIYTIPNDLHQLRDIVSFLQIARNARLSIRLWQHTWNEMRILRIADVGLSERALNRCEFGHLGRRQLPSNRQQLVSSCLRAAGRQHGGPCAQVRQGRVSVLC
jgi:hypothetical protein